MDINTRPVALQVRHPMGIWKSAALFDAGDEQAEHHMREAVKHLAAVDELAKFRIVTREPLPVVLLTYSAVDGWRPV